MSSSSQDEDEDEGDTSSHVDTVWECFIRGRGWGWGLYSHSVIVAAPWQGKKAIVSMIVVMMKLWSASSEDEDYRDTSSSNCVLLKLHPDVPSSSKNCCILVQQCNKLYCSHDDTVWALHPSMRIIMILSFSKNCCTLVEQEGSSLYSSHDGTDCVNSLS